MNADEDTDGGFEDLSALISTLSSNGFRVAPEQHVADALALIARRADWLFPVAHMHTFVTVFRVGDLDADRAEALSDAARDYAIEHKGGMPRGLQTGTITIPTFIGRESSEDLRDWFRREHNHRRASMEFPVFADMDTHELVLLQGRLKLGYVFEPHVRGIVKDILGPGLGCKAR